MSAFNWKELDDARANLIKRAEALKQSFVQMPGGAPAGDPVAGAMDPAAAGAMDPAADGGIPPEMAGAMPSDPAAAGAVDPAMAGMDPAAMAAMAGGVPPVGVDPAMAGMMGGMPPPMPADAGAGGAAAGAAGAGTPEPTLTLTLSQLWDVVTKVLGLAKKIGANGQGVPAEGAAPAQATPAPDAIKAAVIEALGDMGITR